MTINEGWIQLGLGMVGTFIATGWGVLKGFELQRRKDTETQIEHKKRLLIGLYLEIKCIQSFQRQSGNANLGMTEYLETSLLEHASQEQLRFIKNSDLIRDLFEMRKLVGLMKQYLSEMRAYKFEGILMSSTINRVGNTALNEKDSVNDMLVKLFEKMMSQVNRVGISERIIDALKTEYDGDIEKDSGSK